MDGSFVGLWIQLDINCRRRFDKDPIAKPVTLMALTDLPEKEHWAHYAQGPSEPTVIVRTWHNPTEARRVGLTPGLLVSVRETGKGQFWLVSDDKAIAKVRADAKAFLNWPLEVIGHLPNLQAANCNQVQLPPPSGKKETPSYTLALRLAGTNPKFQD